MSKIVQWKRGNTSATTSYTGYEGEMTVNTETWNLHIHDGITAGGYIIVSNGSGSFSSITVTSNLSVGGNVTLSAPGVPATASAPGTAGSISWDGDYVYVCVATDTWKRATISTW